MASGSLHISRTLREARPFAAALLLALCSASGALAQDAPTAPPWKPDRPNAAPPYPADSRLNNEQGQVLLRVMTDAAGKPTRVEVQQSSGFNRLDQAAVKAVERWQFRPLPQDGTVTWREVPINFVIGG